MNYTKIYTNLINRAKDRLLDCYVESHHIIPRCIGGDNSTSNLVNLTAEEHYIAHQLLVKIYPDNNKLAYAARMMSVANSTMKRNNKLYGWIKRRCFLTPMPQETRDKISNALTGKLRGPLPEETKEKLRGANPLKANTGDANGFFGKTHTNDVINHLSKVCGITHKGKSKSAKTRENMRISFTDDRRNMLSNNRRELNLAQSSEHKAATKLSNINRGIQTQKLIISSNIVLYDMIFAKLLENKSVTEIYKSLGTEYKLVWKIKNKFDYFYKIYLDVKNSVSAQDNNVDNV